MATFRASPALRERLDGGSSGPLPFLDPPSVAALVDAMRAHGGGEVPGLGRLDVVPAKGRKKARLTFRAAEALNARLSPE